MIKVFKINRRGIALALLALAGVAFCILGFGGITGKLTGWLYGNSATPAAIAGEEHQTGKSIGGGVPVESAPAPREPVATFAGDNNNDADYFVEYRMERERVRGMEMETMREVLASPDAGEEIRKSAHERLLRLSSHISREMEMENLIRARGFKDAAVFLDENTVTVVVKNGETAAGGDGHAGIVELVTNNTGVESDDIIIITRE